MNTTFGPAHSDTSAPIIKPAIGPQAMIARLLPLRRAAANGSAVASAWVAMFIAANDNPQVRRATSRHQTPGRSAYASEAAAEPSTAAMQAVRGPWVS